MMRPANRPVAGHLVGVVRSGTLRRRWPGPNSRVTVRIVPWLDGPARGGELIAISNAARTACWWPGSRDPALSEAFAQLADTIDAGRVTDHHRADQWDPALEARRYRDDLVQAGFAGPAGFQEETPRLILPARGRRIP